MVLVVMFSGVCLSIIFIIIEGKGTKFELELTVKVEVSDHRVGRYGGS